MDTIPWGLLKESELGGSENGLMFQWILFLGAYLKKAQASGSNALPRFSGYYSLGLT